MPFFGANGNLKIELIKPVRDKSALARRSRTEKMSTKELFAYSKRLTMILLKTYDEEVRLEVLLNFATITSVLQERGIHR